MKELFSLVETQPDLYLSDMLYEGSATISVRYLRKNSQIRTKIAHILRREDFMGRDHVTQIDKELD